MRDINYYEIEWCIFCNTLEKRGQNGNVRKWIDSVLGESQKYITIYRFQRLEDF